MELQEFITESITQIIKGTKDAQEKLKDLGVIISPQLSFTTFLNKRDDLSNSQSGNAIIIEFDIALSTSKSNEKTGKAGLVVASVGIGGHFKKSNTNNTISKIKFPIPITLPFFKPDN